MKHPSYTITKSADEVIRLLASIAPAQARELAMSTLNEVERLRQDAFAPLEQTHYVRLRQARRAALHILNALP